MELLEPGMELLTNSGEWLWIILNIGN
jgi:hypothetical protein